MQKKLVPIYQPSSKPMKVFVLFSGGASGTRYLLEEDDTREYEIVGALTDSPKAKGIEYLEERNVPVRRKKYFSGGFFSETVKEVKTFEPDIILLSGFMRIVKQPLLSEFQNRIINVHPADLRVKDDRGERKYTGADAVYDAVVAGEEQLRSTVHLITRAVDEGPILVLSGSFPVQTDMVKTFRKWNTAQLREYSDSLQEWMKWAGDGPSISKALDLFAKGKIATKGSQIFIKDREEFEPGYFDLQKGEVVRCDQ